MGPSQIMRKALPNSTKDKEIQTTKQVNFAAPLPYQNVLPMEIQAPRSILMKPTTERSLDDVVMTDAYSNNLEYNSPPSIAHINKPQIKYQPMDTSVPPNNFPQIDMDTTVPPLTYSANPQIEYKKQAEAMDTTVPKPPIEYINSLDQYQLPPINDDERIVDLGESMDEGVPERPAIMQEPAIGYQGIPSITHQKRPPIVHENKPAIEYVKETAKKNHP